jgi:hypothetical protein
VGSRRTIDFLITLANKVELVEVKSGLPLRLAGPAMRRLSAQLKAAQGAGQRPKVVFVAAFEDHRMEDLISYFGRNGVDVSPSDVLNGSVAFAKWLGDVFHEVCIEQ